MSKLEMDTSKDIFTVDKKKLIFNIDINASKLSTNSNNNTEEPQPAGKDNIHITNLTESYLAFQTKSTKKNYYAVDPTYCVVPPKGIQEINLTLYLKPGEKPNSKNHRFQFIGFIILEEEKDQNARDLFKSYTEKKQKVFAKEIKCEVEFIGEEPSGEGSPKINLGDGNESNNPNNKGEEENLRFSEVLGKPKVEKDINKVEEDLKKENEKLKEQTDNLTKEIDNLKKEINKATNSDKVSNKYIYKVPGVEEIKLSRNILLGIFFFSLLVGFILVK